MNRSVAAVEKTLLAKSVGRQEDETAAGLLAHLQAVHFAATHILRCSGDAQLQCLGLDPALWLPRFQRVVTLAAALHDIGKANHQFQRMIYHPFSANQQALRHEWASMIVMDGVWHEAIRSVVDSDEEWQIVRWCVSGHHPKFGRLAPPDVNEGSTMMYIPLDHPDFDGITQWLQSTFCFRTVLSRQHLKIDLLDFDFDSEGGLSKLREATWDSEDFFAKLPDDWRRFVAAAKDCLIAADVAGSVIPFHLDSDNDMQWIDQTLGMELDTPSICKAIIARRLKPSEKVRPFQERIIQSPTRCTLAEASCGSGKTLAAYLWARTRCDSKRLFFCYPTTGTGTQGFRDYLVDPELESAHCALIHSRRDLDFELLIKGGQNNAEHTARIESLDVWRSKIIACTVDCVLGVIQNNRRGMFSWPAIAQGSFVFDEIHSYDDRLFDALLHFLGTMRGANVLLMTASLQQSRKRAIESLLGNELTLVVGDPEIEELKRYSFPGAMPDKKKELDELDDLAWQLIDDEITRADGCGKVLFVTNTVARAMSLVDATNSTGGLLTKYRPLVYHSRFKYVDRLNRHSEVVNTFSKESKKPVVAVTTQVCEQSLDLQGVTLLISELAPPWALIQRCGRLARTNQSGDPPGRLIVIQPRGWDGKPTTLPYEQSDLELARRWLENLSGDVSQSELALAWKDLGDSNVVQRFQSGWLNYGPSNPVLELRESSPSVTLVMAEDCDDGSRRLAMKDIQRVSLSMPLRKQEDWQLTRPDGRPILLSGIPIARPGTIEYCPNLGARWRFNG